MGKQNPVVITGLSFYTKKALEDHTRKLLTQLGPCHSVKERDSVAFNFLKELAQRHPRASEKLRDFQDFKIRQNPVNVKGLELHVVRSGMETEDISWHICISGKERGVQQDLNSAMRSAISDQITLFKQTSDCSTCTLCRTSIDRQTCHVDHVRTFKDLATEFLKGCPLEAPTSFVQEGTFLFFKQGGEFEEAWKAYHQQHATLRILCPTCNLCRKKSGGT